MAKEIYGSRQNFHREQQSAVPTFANFKPLVQSKKYWMIRLCDCFKLMHENIWADSIEHELFPGLLPINLKCENEFLCTRALKEYGGERSLQGKGEILNCRDPVHPPLISS